MTIFRRIPISAWIVAAFLAAFLAYAVPRLEFGSLPQLTSGAPLTASGAVAVEKGSAELPADNRFEKVSATASLELLLDRTTGHFKVNDLRNGNVWYSYPDPDHWEQENQSGIWRTHLRSPIMLRYMDLQGKKAQMQQKDTNFLEERGTISDLRLIDGGFRLTFDMPSKQFSVPVEVTIENDSVAVRVVDSGIKEGALSLLSLRAYPMFGAAHAIGQEGFLFIPDGSGALIPFREYHTNTVRIYQEPVYGMDDSFRPPMYQPSRQQISMPVFGLRSGNRAFVSVLEDGAEFAEIIASPSKVFSDYNWTTAQQSYRMPYTVVTNEKKATFFQTYNRTERFGSDRVVRYFLLDKDKTGYVDMAERYRSYLIARYGLVPLQTGNGKLPLSVGLVGAEQEDGLLNNRYLPKTTTSEAWKIIKTLYEHGIDKMTVQYMGWQKDGYSASGNVSAVDRRIGGNDGMKSFVDLAHSLMIPVYLQVNYGANRSGGDGFERTRHGQRDMGGTILDDQVSLGFLGRQIDRHIGFFQSLGIDGVQIQQLGNSLNSDYNTSYPASRDASRLAQEQLFKRFKDISLDVRGVSSNLYTLPYVSTIDSMQDDYSYDTFSDSAIPFMQIALHGLVTYTSHYSNERQEFRKQMLHNLEYGAAPSYVFSYDNSGNLVFAHELHLLNPDYRDWLETAAQEYRLMNEALGDVQDKWIVNHRTLAPDVKETTYAGGKRIVVNYGSEPYAYGQSTVKPMDYLIVAGGSAK